MIGSRFGRLTVIAVAPHYVSPKGARHRRWVCRCDCGNETSVTANNLRAGIQSCGCYRTEVLHEIRTHGLTKSPLYRVWRVMQDRCYNKNMGAFRYYGGRGIRVCQRWRDSIEAFVADMGPRPQGGTIDRIDPNGDYCPDNCRWATRHEQANNKRNNRLVTVFGVQMTVAEAAMRYDVASYTLYRVATAGQSIDDYLRTGHRPKQPKKTHCKRGHPFTAENSYWRGRHMCCRICKVAGTKAWQQRHGK